MDTSVSNEEIQQHDVVSALKNNLSDNEGSLENQENNNHIKPFIPSTAALKNIFVENNIPKAELKSTENIEPMDHSTNAETTPTVEPIDTTDSQSMTKEVANETPESITVNKLNKVIQEPLPLNCDIVSDSEGNLALIEDFQSQNIDSKGCFHNSRNDQTCPPLPFTTKQLFILQSKSPPDSRPVMKYSLVPLDAMSFISTSSASSAILICLPCKCRFHQFDNLRDHASSIHGISMEGMQTPSSAMIVHSVTASLQLYALLFDGSTSVDKLRSKLNSTSLRKGSGSSSGSLTSPIARSVIGFCDEHIEPNADCVKCEMAILSPKTSAVAGQMTAMHSRNSCKTLKCPKCNWHYKYQETLEIHMKEKHPENEQACIYCVTKQSHPKLSRGESYMCGYKPYRCEVCNYSTTTKGNLSIHMQSDKHINNMQDMKQGDTISQPSPPRSDSPSQSPTASQPAATLPQPTPTSSNQIPSATGSSNQITRPKFATQQKSTWRCDVCNYETNIARNLRIHMTSEKHTHNMIILQQNVKSMQRNMHLTMENLVGRNDAAAMQQLGTMFPFDPLGIVGQMEALSQQQGGDTETTKISDDVTSYRSTRCRDIYGCVICNTFTTDDPAELENHLNVDRSSATNSEHVTITAENHYLCNLCQYKTNLKANFQLHCKTDKHVQRVQLVNHIREGGAENEWRMRYLNMPNPIHIVCNVCTYQSNNIHKMRLHALSPSHTIGASLFVHLRRKDELRTEYRYFCGVCSEIATNKITMVNHVRQAHATHMEKLASEGWVGFKVDISSTDSLPTASIVNELSEDHESIAENDVDVTTPELAELKPEVNEDCEIQCPLCSTKLISAELVEDHLMTTHNVNKEGAKRLMSIIDPSSWIKPSKDEDVNDNFRCQTCTKTFKDIEALFSHQNQEDHLELRSTPRGPGYLCWKKGCNQYFKTAQTLQTHFREIHAKSTSDKRPQKPNLQSTSAALMNGLSVSDNAGNNLPESNPIMEEKKIDDTCHTDEEVDESHPNTFTINIKDSNETDYMPEAKNTSDTDATCSELAGQKMLSESKETDSEDTQMHVCRFCKLEFSSETQLGYHIETFCTARIYASKNTTNRSSAGCRKLLKTFGIECVMGFLETEQHAGEEGQAGDYSSDDGEERVEDQAKSDNQSEDKSTDVMTERVKCEDCDQTFSGLWILKSHIEQHHDKVLPQKITELFGKMYKEELEQKLNEEASLNSNATDKSESEIKSKSLSQLTVKVESSSAQATQPPIPPVSSMPTNPMDMMGYTAAMAPWLGLFPFGLMPNAAMFNPMNSGVAQPVTSMPQPMAAQQIPDKSGGLVRPTTVPISSAQSTNNQQNSLEKRARTRISDDQLKVLRQYFDINNSPSEEAIMEMAHKTGLPAKVIKHWFRNTLFKERQRNKDSPYNFNIPPQTTLNLEEYEKTGKLEEIKEENSKIDMNVIKKEEEMMSPAPTTPAQLSTASLTSPSPLSFCGSGSSEKKTDDHLQRLMTMADESSYLLSPGSPDNSSDSSESYTHVHRMLNSPAYKFHDFSTGCSSKRANRTRFNDYQIKTLQEYFEQNAYPKDEELEQLSRALNLPNRVIVVWFQNARQKARKVYESGPSTQTDAPTASTTPKNTYPCKKCGVTFSGYYELVKHQKRICMKNNIVPLPFGNQEAKPKETPTTPAFKQEQTTPKSGQYRRHSMRHTFRKTNIPGGRSIVKYPSLRRKYTMFGARREASVISKVLIKRMLKLLAKRSFAANLGLEKIELDLSDVSIKQKNGFSSVLSSSSAEGQQIQTKKDNLVNKEDVEEQPSIAESNDKKVQAEPVKAADVQKVNTALFSPETLPYMSMMGLPGLNTSLQDQMREIYEQSVKSKPDKQEKTTPHITSNDTPIEPVKKDLTPTTGFTKVNNSFSSRTSDESGRGLSTSGASFPADDNVSMIDSEPGDDSAFRVTPDQSHSPVSPHHGLSRSQNKRYRTNLTPLQVHVMRYMFKDYKTPTMSECETLGGFIGLQKRVVQVWFQNARAKEKKNKQIAGQGSESDETPTECLLCNVSYSLKSTLQDHVFSPKHILTIKRTFTGKLVDADRTAMMTADENSAVKSEGFKSRSKMSNKDTNWMSSATTPGQPSANSAFQKTQPMMSNLGSLPGAGLLGMNGTDLLPLMYPGLVNPMASLIPGLMPGGIPDPSSANLALSALCNPLDFGTPLTLLQIPGEAIKSIESRLAHTNTNTATYTQDCKTLSDLLELISTADMQMVTMTSVDVGYVCRKCQFVFPRKESCIAHQFQTCYPGAPAGSNTMLKIEQQQFTCKPCNQSCSTTEEFKLHCMSETHKRAQIQLNNNNYVKTLSDTAGQPSAKKLKLA